MFTDSETGMYVIEYLVYINDQPPGLPIDHISTLENSFNFWEKYEFNTNRWKKSCCKILYNPIKSMKQIFGLHGL